MDTFKPSYNATPERESRYSHFASSFKDSPAKPIRQNKIIPISVRISKTPDNYKEYLTQQ